MRQDLVIQLLLLLLSPAAVGSTAVWFPRGSTLRDSSNTTAWRKPAAALQPELPRRTFACLPYASVLGQNATAASVTAEARRANLRLLPQHPALTTPSVSPPSVYGAGGAAPPVQCDPSTKRLAQEEANSAIDSVVAASDDLSVRPLLSRQLLVWGPEQQKVLPGSSVLLIGAGGAAVEAAKCLLQSGVGCVLLADPEEPVPQECAGNFALAEHAEQQEAAASSAVAEAAVVEACGGAEAVPYPSRLPQGDRVGLSAKLLGHRGQQKQPLPPTTRAGIACAALRRVGAPYARVSEVSLHIQPGETAAAWQARVESVLQHVDVLLLCDRPLQQKLFYSAMARKLWSQRKEQMRRKRLEKGRLRQEQQELHLHTRKDGPLVVSVCTAGLTGRVAVDFGDFTFDRVSEEAALTALLQKHARPQKQQQQQYQEKKHIERVHFTPLSSILTHHKRAIEEQQLLSFHVHPDMQQQYLTAAFEALDAAETDGRALIEDPEPVTATEENGATPAAAAATTDSREAAACAAAGNLRSWNANRLPSASLVAARAAAIWKRRYGPSAARAAAAAAAAAVRSSHQSSAAISAAAEAAAAAAISTGQIEAGRFGALMARGARGYLAPIAAAMGALAAQETLKGLTRKYRPLQGPFVLHALELLGLTAQDQMEDAAYGGVVGNVGGSSCNTQICDRYTGRLSAESSAQRPASRTAAADARAAAKVGSTRAARTVGGASREAAARRVPWEGQQQLLGLEMQRRLSHLRVLLVGAGAIGCEMLKNFALMGVSADCCEPSSNNGTSNNSSSSRRCCSSSSTSCSPSRSDREQYSCLARVLTWCLNGVRCTMLKRAGTGAAGVESLAAAAGKEPCAKPCPGGLLSLMDGDTVETSNLSRQVLFTASSLQQPKATAAAAAALRFCSRTQLRPFPFMLSPATLWRLPPMYIQEQDLVVAALDSVDARLYVDSLCLLHSKPWVEAGTLGLRGHSQSLVPYLTEHYAAAASGAAVNASPTVRTLTAVPVCSVRGAPTAPLHAVHWASAQLQQTFKTDIAAAHALLLQLLQQQLQSPQRTSAEGQVHRRIALPATASPHAVTPGAPDDVQAALYRLGMAPAAVAAAAAGPLRLRLLLRIAVEVLRVQRQTREMSDHGGRQALQELQQQREHRQGHHEEHGDSRDGVRPLSIVHLRLLSFAVLLFNVLYRTEAVEGSSQGDQAAETNASSSEDHVKRPCNQKSLILDPTDADTVDFVAAAAQLLAGSLGLKSLAETGTDRRFVESSTQAILQQEQAEELLLQGKGLGPWSRQCVAEALQLLLPNVAHNEAGVSELDAASSDPTAFNLSALAEELVREVAATAAGVTKGAELRLSRSPAVPPLSADSAVPLRFLTSAARLRCRAFGLMPLPGPEETQQLIGRIVPATATATTLAAALACLEVYRLAALGLVGTFPGQLLQHREHQQRQNQHGKIVQQAGRGSPALWLDRGERRIWQAAAKQQHLRSSFFSLSVPFLAEAPPLPPPTHRFLVGRWRGQPFSPWHFLRLRLRGGVFSSSSHGRVRQGTVQGEAEAAETITISELVELIEKDMRIHVSSLTCEGTLLYAASKERGTVQQQHQLQAVLPLHIAALFGQHEPQTIPDPGENLSEALRRAVFAPRHRKTQLYQEQQQQKTASHMQQQDKGPTWAMVRIAASDPLGADVPLPALKVLIRPIS